MTSIPVLLFAWALAPTAIVDSVHGTAAVTPLQMLWPGETLDIPDEARVRLAYFASCVHETVRGARLRVGVTASLTLDGEVERVEADCTPPVGSRHGPAVAGALILRSHGAHSPEVRRLRTRTPVLIGNPGSRFALHRLDPPGRRIFLTSRDGTLPLGAIGIVLESDSLYEICTMDRCRRVWIDATDHHDAGPVLERVVLVP